MSNCLTNSKGLVRLNLLIKCCTLRSLAASSLTWCWRRFSCEIAYLAMLDATVSTPRSRWMSLLRAYRGVLTKHLSTLFWYRCIMSILLFSHIPTVGHHMSILVAAFVYIRAPYCILRVRIGFRAAGTFLEIWFAVPLVSPWYAPSSGRYPNVTIIAVTGIYKAKNRKNIEQFVGAV
jgi:hypothetical protein